MSEKLQKYIENKKYDLALIPLKASSDDVAGALETHSLIQELNKLNLI